MIAMITLIVMMLVKKMIITIYGSALKLKYDHLDVDCNDHDNCDDADNDNDNNDYQSDI